MKEMFVGIEWIVSSLEVFLGLYSVGIIAERRFVPRRYWGILGLLSGLSGLGVLLLNLIDMRISLPTILYALLVMWMSACVLYKGKSLEFLMTEIGYLAFMLLTDNLLITLAVTAGAVKNISVFGMERVLLAVVCKSIEALLIFAFSFTAQKIGKRFRIFSKSLTISIVCLLMGCAGSIYWMRHMGDLVGAKLDVSQVRTGSFFVVLFCAVYLWIQIKDVQKERAYAVSQNRVLEKNYIAAKEAYEANAKLYHDMNNHFMLVQSYLKNGKVKEAERYLEKISGERAEYIPEYYTGIEAVDYILNQKLHRARKNQICMKIRGEYPKDCKIDPVDLCTILTNLLDNAIEACMKQPEGAPKEIQAAIRRVHHFIIIRVENSSMVSPDIREGRLYTSKRDRDIHGWGSKNVLSAAEKYQGTVQYEYQNGIFTASVMLFICNENPQGYEFESVDE